MRAIYITVYIIYIPIFILIALYDFFHFCVTNVSYSDSGDRKIIENILIPHTLSEKFFIESLFDKP
jgi:hypothetical protein